MPSNIRRVGQCASCTFNVSEWLAPSLLHRSGSRFYSAGVTVRRLKSHHGGSDSREGFGISDRAGSTNQYRPIQRLQKNPWANGIHLETGFKNILSRGDLNDGNLEMILLDQFSLLLERLTGSNEVSPDSAGRWGAKDEEYLLKKVVAFQEMIKSCCVKAHKYGMTTKEQNPLFFRLWHAFVNTKVRGLRAEMKYAFLNSVIEPQFSARENKKQKKLADLRYPLEWFPATRAMQRTIHLHVGPTNSGKTYHALQRLEAAESGIYAGPLRLLAHEVYTRFNTKGKPCALVTGEERRIPDGVDTYMTSCTVEMVPLNSKVEIAVIDEIQMIGDPDRGWAWSQALLGVQAKEVHLCGELRTIPLIQDLCAAMGDKLKVHRYERLSPLKSMKNSLRGDLQNLQKGDAVILFSRLAIHAMKSRIEQATGKRCAIVYGSLPPETRAQQANLFNDPNNDYDFLVASDAVGMGLNLSIKRIIFEATTKFDGFGFGVMEASDIKQIAGRAGRYRTAHDAVQEGPDVTPIVNDPLPLEITDKPKKTIGWVTTLENFDLPVVQAAMLANVEPLRTAGLFPPDNILAQFASSFPRETPFSYIILRLHEISTINHLFHLCRITEQVEIADVIQPYNMSINDRIIFLAAPVALREAGFVEVLAEYAKCVADQSGGELLEMKSLNLDLLDQSIEDYPERTNQYLGALETLHKSLTLYLWLSYRFAGVFRSQALAFHTNSLVEEKINECLADVHWDDRRGKMLKSLRRKMLAKEARKMAEIPQCTAAGLASSPVADGGGAMPLQWDEAGPDPLPASALVNV